jgi:photosystem II stability/assembly factor-like uncharacterized protein
VNADRVYALHTILRVTNDGGATFSAMPRKNRHVDDHALWIDPQDNTHLVVGCDGGVYESHDLGGNWHFKANLPITQFYRVSVDESKPFYFVYGGTQDNNSQGGPSRTTDKVGITNADWFITVGGDGYETRVDPEDPNTVYAQWQYGGLVRHDRRSGERVDIKPRAAPDDDPLRWNWDSPLILSAHSAQRLYFAANRLFRTDDRGETWRAVSEDLTRQIDRNQLKVMGRIQSPDAVAKDDSTSFYGTIVSLDESPLDESLLYVGTDDGLVQVTENGGGAWRSIGELPGIPANTFVSCLTASPTEKDTVYAAFDNHKQGDFKPYLLMSQDKGVTWTSIASDLPERNVVYSILQDHVQPDLLFAGTEFGVYTSIDRGAHWVRLKSGLPTIAVRDMVIQKRENDLVLGTFGRGFYILDDYTPLRHITEENLKSPAVVYPVKPALRYVERSRLGGGNGLGSQGASHYRAPNPSFGAVFSYRLGDKFLSRKEARRKQEKEHRKKGEEIPYPSLDELRAEAVERDPQVVLVVRDDSGAVVARVGGPRGKGLHRVAWNLRYPGIRPIAVQGSGAPAKATGPLALPGTYTMELVAIIEREPVRLHEPVAFEVVPLDHATFAAKDKPAALRFQRRAARLERAVLAAGRVLGEWKTGLSHLRQAVLDTAAADLGLLNLVAAAREQVHSFEMRLGGDTTRRAQDRPSLPGIRQRIHAVTSNQGNVTSPPTQSQIAEVERTEALFTDFHAELSAFAAGLYANLGRRIEAAGAAWIPAQFPRWDPK